jgi:peroxiredoxin Q/BCP
VQRNTYLVGADGKIERIWEQVKPEGHAEEVLLALADTPN